MAIQPPQRFELDDLAHVEREARTIYAPGATPGDVLVVQSDHSLVAAPGGGSQPFTPASLTGLALWLDASDASTINAGSPADGDPVSAWADKSGNGFDAAQATAENQPVYKTAIQNGKSVLRFDSAVTARFLALSGPGLDVLKSAPGFTLAAAFTNRVVVSDGVGENDLLGIITGGGTARLLAAEFDTTGCYFSFAAGNSDAHDLGLTSANAGFAGTDASDEDAVSAPASYSAVWCADMTTFRTTVATSEQQGSPGYGNGGIPAATGLTRGPFPATTPDQVLVSGDGNGYFYPLWDADLFEIVLVARACPAGERRQLLEYLAAKWATL